MSDILNFSWPIGGAINVHVVDVGIPFDTALATRQVYKLCDYINFVSNGDININYAGTVAEEPAWDDIDGGNIYVRWVDEIEGDYWAWTEPKTLFGTQAIGGRLSFVRDDVNSAERFAGILTHELFHLLRLAHTTPMSVMENNPYIGYQYQGMPMMKDMLNLGVAWPGPPLKLISPIYDYGEEDPSRFILLIQTIEAGLDEYYSVYIHGKKVDGVWGLSVIPAQVVPETTAFGATAKVLADNLLRIPIRYMGASMFIYATLVETNGEWLFQDVEVKDS